MVYLKQIEDYMASSTPPSNPQKGDLWQELDANGVSRYGWFWSYTGSEWRSPEQFWNISFAGITASTTFYLDTGDIGTRYIRLVERSIRTYSSVAQNSTNNWSCNLFQVQANNGQGALTPQQNTIGNAASVFVYKSVALNAMLQQPLLQLNVSPNGMPGSLFGTARFKYYFAR